MKTIITITALIFSTNIALAQKIKTEDVPGAVLNSFNDNFKGIQVKTWEKEKGAYEAEFVVNKVENSATFNADGVLLETEKEISIQTLPKIVLDFIRKDYATYKISEASEITAPSGSQNFEVEIKKGKEEFDLIFDSNGNFLSKEVETGDDKDDKD